MLSLRRLGPCSGLGRIMAVQGGRGGLRHCGDGRKQFTVTVGTVFESSHVKLHFWLQAARPICSGEELLHPAKPEPEPAKLGAEKLTSEEQRRRFIEVAREAGASALSTEVVAGSAIRKRTA